MVIHCKIAISLFFFGLRCQPAYRPGPMQPKRTLSLSRKLLEKENEHSEAKLAALKAARNAENQVWQALSLRRDSSTKGPIPIWRAASQEIGGLRKFKVGEEMGAVCLVESCGNEWVQRESNCRVLRRRRTTTANTQIVGDTHR